MVQGDKKQPSTSYEPRLSTLMFDPDSSSEKSSSWWCVIVGGVSALRWGRVDVSRCGGIISIFGISLLSMSVSWKMRERGANGASMGPSGVWP